MMMLSPDSVMMMVVRMFVHAYVARHNHAVILMVHVYAGVVYICVNVAMHGTRRSVQELIGDLRLHMATTSV